MHFAPRNLILLSRVRVVCIRAVICPQNQGPRDDMAWSPRLGHRPTAIPFASCSRGGEKHAVGRLCQRSSGSFLVAHCARRRRRRSPTVWLVRFRTGEPRACPRKLVPVLRRRERHRRRPLQRPRAGGRGFVRPGRDLQRPRPRLPLRAHPPGHISFRLAGSVDPGARLACHGPRSSPACRSGRCRPICGRLLSRAISMPKPRSHP